MENIAHKKYKCAQCDYTTNRKFNIERHTVMVHHCKLSEVAFLHPNSTLLTNNSTLLTNNSTLLTNNSTLLTSNSTLLTNNAPNETTFKCIDCNRCYSSARNLHIHQNVCNKIPLTICCQQCHKFFSTKQSLTNHKKKCTSTVLIEKPLPEGPSIQSAETINNNNIQNQNNIQTQNIQNVYNILTFPEQGQDFDFICEKITNATMRALLNTPQNPAIKFNKFVNKVLEDPQNRIIRKTNPNASHSMIHTGNGEWELAYDEDVLPLLTHHMTTAALQKTQEIKKDVEKMRDLYHKLEPFKDYVFDINTDNESKAYTDTIYRIKLIIINMTKKWLNTKTI